MLRYHTEHPAVRHFTANEDGGTTYRTLTLHVEPDPDAVEVQELRGDEYLVAPVVAVAEGVLNGGFLPFREIQKSAPGWNGVPLTVNHPEDDDGNFVPANQPDALEEHVIGRFLNAAADQEGRSLAGELWINLAEVKWLVENTERIGELAKLAVEKIRDGERLEVSTGYWHGEVQESGEFEGAEYDTVQVDLLPDHLAVLPNAEGACDWEGSTTASGCGAPRMNLDGRAGASMAFATNSATVQAAMQTGIDVALHQADYDPAEIDVANLLDTARTPDFDGTTSESWSAPGLSDIADGFGWDDVSSVDDLSQEQRQQAAQLSLLGDPDAERFEELVFFPVVDPDGRDLNENALDAVLSGRGAQADITQEQLESARGVARTLLEDEFDRDLDENVAGWRARAANAFFSALGIDADLGALVGSPAGDAGGTDADPTETEVSYAVHSANCNCHGCSMSDDTPDRIQRLANQTEFSVEELEALDDDAVDKIDASLGSDDDGGGDSGDDGGSSTNQNDGGGDPPEWAQNLTEKVESFDEKVESLESRFDEQQSERCEELVESITAQTKFEEEDLEELGIAEDPDALETFAEKQGAMVDTDPFFGGRAAGAGTSEDGGEFEVEVGGYFHSQETEADAEEQEAG